MSYELQVKKNQVCVNKSTENSSTHTGIHIKIRVLIDSKLRTQYLKLGHIKVT